jgi:hypothetical protein
MKNHLALGKAALEKTVSIQGDYCHDANLATMTLRNKLADS